MTGVSWKNFRNFQQQTPRTPQEALSILRYTHFPGVDIKKELEMVDQLGKIRLSNADWVQDTDHYLAKLVSNFWLF